MTMLSPAATYHAELREQLGTVGRALSVQRGLLWLPRGVAARAAAGLRPGGWAGARGAGARPHPAFFGADRVADRRGLARGCRQPLHPPQNARASAKGR